MINLLMQLQEQRHQIVAMQADAVLPIATVSLNYNLISTHVDTHGKAIFACKMPKFAMEIITSMS